MQASNAAQLRARSRRGELELTRCFCFTLHLSVLLSDLSKGQERYPIEVLTELEPSASELESLHGCTYIMKNKLTVREWEKTIPMLDSSITIAEAVNRTAHKRGGQRGGIGSADEGEDEEDAAEVDDNPAELRRQLHAGLAFPVRVQLTQRKGGGVFAKANIPDG